MGVSAGRPGDPGDRRARRRLLVEGGAVPAGISAAREAGFATTIAVARGDATPEALRAAGAAAVVADLQELLGTARS